MPLIVFNTAFENGAITVLDDAFPFAIPQRTGPVNVPRLPGGILQSDVIPAVFDVMYGIVVSRGLGFRGIYGQFFQK